MRFVTQNNVKVNKEYSAQHRTTWDWALDYIYFISVRIRQNAVSTILTKTALPTLTTIHFSEIFGEYYCIVFAYAEGFIF